MPRVGKIYTVGREHGRNGHDMRVAQSKNYSLETHPSDNNIATNMANISSGDGPQDETRLTDPGPHLKLLETLQKPSSSYPWVLVRCGGWIDDGCAFRLTDYY